MYDLDTFRIGIQLTEACNFACAHCGTRSSPKRHGSFDSKYLDHAIRQIFDVDPNPVIGFTSGEVFTVEDKLWRAADKIEKLGGRYGVTTNGSWGAEKGSRNRILSRLKNADSLGLSADRFHAKFINPRIIGDLALEAKSRGIRVSIRYTLQSGEDEKEALRRLGLSVEDTSLVHFSGAMSIGFAVKLDDALFPVFENEPCGAASNPIITQKLQVFACCGESMYMGLSSPLFLGSLSNNSLASILQQASESIEIQAIRTMGPVGMANRILADDLREKEKVATRSPCGNCRVMFRSDKRRRLVHDWCEAKKERITTLRAMLYGEV